MNKAINNLKKILKEVKKDELTEEKQYKKCVFKKSQQTEKQQKSLKVTLNSAEDKKKIFKNLSKLKCIDKFEKVSISKDFTIAEQEILKTWHEKARGKNNHDP